MKTTEKASNDAAPETFFHADIPKLVNVFEALQAGDISECKTTEVAHVCELLVSVMYLEELRPGFVGGMFSEFIPYFMRAANRSAMQAMAEKMAASGGFATEWQACMDAARHPTQKDLLARAVDLEMKSGFSKPASIQRVAKAMKRDEEDVRRTVNRQNSRIKKAAPGR